MGDMADWTLEQMMDLDEVYCEDPWLLMKKEIRFTIPLPAGDPLGDADPLLKKILRVLQNEADDRF